MGVGLVVAVMVPAGASAAPRPDLSVDRLGSPPAQVEQGASFSVAGRIANDGRRPAPANVRFVLRRGPDAGPLGTRLAGRRIDEVPARGSAEFRHSLTVPDDTEPGEYGLAACVKRRGRTGSDVCRSAKRRVTVTGPRVTPGDDGGPTDPPAPPPDDPPPPGPGFSPGARSAGDALFPEIGNGGYDVSHYDLVFDYDPIANEFDSATATITADATQNLSEFSLDLQGLDVAGITVDGAPAAVSRQGTKLIIDPAGEGIPDGHEFDAVVEYTGTPEEVIDPDGSSEGWVRDGGLVVDGGFVVNEPIGAQGWFPSNNYPTDKATYDFRITVPMAYTALGNGELVANTANGDGTRTWHWRTDEPMATYLSTATVGLFNFTPGTITDETPDPDRTLPEYRAVDTAFTGVPETLTNTELDQIEPMTNFLGGIYGPYPFDSTGGVVDNAPGVGYALEVQTKPHYATPLTPASRSTVLHELAHQWFGDSVTLATWSDIWFNEGWASWSEWYWDHQVNGGDTPEQHWTDEWNAAADDDWNIPPADVGDPADLFAHFPVYVRSTMTLEGYRQIVGDTKFFELARRLQTEFAGDNISTQEFIDLAIEVSDLVGPQRDLLAQYFDQWLYGEDEPTVLPNDPGF